MDLETLLDRINIGEDQDIEFKSADTVFPMKFGKLYQLLPIQMAAILFISRTNAKLCDRAE